MATFRSFRHVKIVWHVANMSTSSRACRNSGIWRTTRQTDKRAALPQQTASRSNCYNEEVHQDPCNMLGRCYEDAYEEVTDLSGVSGVSLACYEEVASKLLLWNVVYSTFYCHVISCALARRDVQLGARPRSSVAMNSSACWRGKA